MLKYKKHLALITCFILAVTLMAGCQPQAKRFIPQQYRNNYEARRYDINNNMLPNNTQNPMTNNTEQAKRDAYGNILSAEFEKSDVGYCKLNNTAPVRTGCGTNYPVLSQLNKGDTVKVLGKLNDWYIVQMPNSTKVGCVNKTNCSPYSSYTDINKKPANIPTPAPAPAPVPSPGPAVGPGATNNGGNVNPPVTTPAPAPAPAPTTPTQATAGMSSEESRILQLCNTERSKQGLKPLKGNTELVKLSRLKSQDMVNKNYFDHYSPTYGSPFDMLKKYGVSYMYAGENIAMNQSADAAFKAWMNSEGHRKNIMNPNFTELGVGIAKKSGSSYIYTQLFIGK